ncbi:uncharacterized protein L203_101066 [Cryptococcus depauperatus CBS 7841]|uniref:Pinin/SDK/MemA protein domain-containing protein n=1 Tax=Cryptococcus depauperatus CBS 7841 TaxID=1295531 RepID=A0AAJ8JP86_9TREE
MEDNSERMETEKPEPAPEAPSRRARTADDKARGKRLFGNLLGTLQKFKTDDKSSRVSEAAKRRAEVSERIEKKLRSENALNHEISETDKELRSLRIATEHAEAVLKQKDIAMTSRHTFLKPTSKFLHTALPLPHTPVYQGNLLNPSPIPLSQGPTVERPSKNDLPPLYYLPKVLLPHQHDVLKSRQANIDELIQEEQAELAAERQRVEDLAKENRERMEELSSKLHELKKQTRQDGARSWAGNNVEERREKKDRKVDDFGRIPREETMDVNHEIKENEPGPNKGEVGDERDERERGVQIEGDDGDIEVEY